MPIVKRIADQEYVNEALASYTETDPTVPAWAKAASKPTYTASEVGADPAGTATSAVSAHNTSADAHNDLRLELKAINDRLTAFFDSDNQTLDELSEIVAYITSNKALIDSITTSKVSVADIINNLTTNVANKPLSAAQGVALKGLIDAVSNSLSNYQPKGDYALRSELPTVPTKVSQLQNDKGYLTEHQDISGKLDASALPTAINTALAQAKSSGEFDGEDGTSVTVKSVSESTADGGSNVVTFSDGNTLTVKNGSKGADGKTPVKGTDYFTEADEEEIVQQVLVALGKPIVGEVDANKNITLVGTLASGVYNVKYEAADGALVDVGQIEIGGVAYTNQLPISTDASGAIYNGKGWKENTRLSGTGTDTADTTYGMAVTGFIPCGDTATIRIKSNVAVMNDYSNQGFCLYDASKTFIYRLNMAALTVGSNKYLKINDDGSIEYSLNAAYWGDNTAGKTVGFIRATFPGINGSTIITINEEIV